jgi:hypothetical protein
MSLPWILLIQAGLLALGVLLALACAIGVAVAAAPARLEALRAGTDRRISLRRATRPLDIPRHVDAWFYRHHRAYGIATIALSLFLLVFLTFGQIPAPELLASDPRYTQVVALLLGVARVLLWAFSLMAFAIGVIVLVRPSALKSLEAQANRWVTPRRQLKGLEREYHGPDGWAARNPRAWGILVAAGAGACLLALILHAPAIADLGG